MSSFTYVCVCKYIYIYIHIVFYMHMHAHLHICIYAYMHICIHAYMHIYMQHISLHVIPHLNVETSHRKEYVHTRIHTDIRARTCIHTDIRAHACIHTVVCAHTCIHTDILARHVNFSTCCLCVRIMYVCMREACISCKNSYIHTHIHMQSHAHIPDENKPFCTYPSTPMRILLFDERLRDCMHVVFVYAKIRVLFTRL